MDANKTPGDLSLPFQSVETRTAQTQVTAGGPSPVES